MTAAAYAKDLLYRIAPQQVEQEARIVNVLKEGDHYTNITFGGDNSGFQVGQQYGPIDWRIGDLQHYDSAKPGYPNPGSRKFSQSSRRAIASASDRGDNRSRREILDASSVVHWI
ncbi:uncharacterized protein N7446_000385 [Penicillium canescens]|uniref:uncharacterized protein n=1 Tax=Penicillium canescens TaxID=5083 RepID=UPI0026DFCF62|nr:uncharacterized protein N7446_000385 [Penicillium canescens]KAJ6059735.1 hypothetical protein N7444_003374 [Penicillium canescens]KAJ6077449.1 hypothetical protein N7446_000385 [Penicillium canescens]KAJ6154216.1 hypothetical protein N7485_012585 [Penicillium canescens]